MHRVTHYFIKKCANVFLIANFIVINFITIIIIARILLLLLRDYENIIIIIVYYNYRRSTLNIHDLKLSQLLFA